MPTPTYSTTDHDLQFGTGNPTVTIVGTDTSGYITYDMSALSTFYQFAPNTKYFALEVIFDTPLADPSSISLSPMNDYTATLLTATPSVEFYVDQDDATTSYFKISAISSSTPLLGPEVLMWAYQVGGQPSTGGGGGNTTLQQAYDNGTVINIALGGMGENPIIINANSGDISGSIFIINDHDGNTLFNVVDSSGPHSPPGADGTIFINRLTMPGGELSLIGNDGNVLAYDSGVWRAAVPTLQAAYEGGSQITLTTGEGQIPFVITANSSTDTSSIFKVRDHNNNNIFEVIDAGGDGPSGYATIGNWSFIDSDADASGTLSIGTTTASAVVVGSGSAITFIGGQLRVMNDSLLVGSTLLAGNIQQLADSDMAIGQPFAHDLLFRFGDPLATKVSMNASALKIGVPISGLATGDLHFTLFDVSSTITLGTQASSGAVRVNATQTIMDSPSQNHRYILQDNGHYFAGTNMGFFGVYPPIAQPTAGGVAQQTTAGSGAAIKIDSTTTGGTGSVAYTVSDIVAALKALGLLAS